VILPSLVSTVLIKIASSSLNAVQFPSSIALESGRAMFHGARMHADAFGQPVDRYLLRK
jgi:hypothetical protein